MLAEGAEKFCTLDQHDDDRKTIIVSILLLKKVQRVDEAKTEKGQR